MRWGQSHETTDAAGVATGGEIEIGLASLTIGAAARNELIDPKIGERHRRIVKTTADGLLVEFDMVDASRCATRVLSAELAGRTWWYRRTSKWSSGIGINLVDIVVEDGDTFGDGVNVAARLEGLAEPAGICVSAGAAALRHGNIPLDAVSVSGRLLRRDQQHCVLPPIGPSQIPATITPPAATSTLQQSSSGQCDSHPDRRP